MKIRASAALEFAVALLSLAPVSTAQGRHISRITVRPDGRQIGALSLAYPDRAGIAASISDDGRFAIVREIVPQAPPNFVFEDVRLLDRANGSQVPILLGVGGAALDSEFGKVSLSPDGTRIVFDSYATNLPGGLSAALGGIYILHRPSGQLIRVTNGMGADPDDYCHLDSMSPNGRFVVFSTSATNLVANDTNLTLDTFVVDVQTGQTTRASVSSSGTESAWESLARGITPDGRFVLFESSGDDLVANDSNGNNWDVFLRDRASGTTELISATPANVSGNSSSTGLWVSADGRYVAFWSDDTDLVAGDVNGVGDVFIRDRQSGTTTLATLTSSGAQVNDYSSGIFSATGRFLFFESYATNIVPGDTNQLPDMFLRDFQTQTTERLTLTPAGGQAQLFLGTTPSIVFPFSMSSNGRFLAFSSQYQDLVAGDSNDALDGFLIDRGSNVAPVTSYCTAKATSTGCVPVISSAGEPHASGLDSFYVSASQVRVGTRGTFIWSLAAASTPFAGGTLCITTPYQSRAVTSGGYGGTSGPCNQGQFVFKVSQAFMAAQGLTPGTTLFAQYLSRDNGYPAPNNVGLSDAITFTIAP